MKSTIHDHHWRHYAIVSKIFPLLILLFCCCNIFSQELIPYRNQKLWGYANASGKIIIEPQYEKAFPAWKNGVCKVMKNGEYILIDAKNQVKTKQAYKQIWEFSNGYAAACKGGEINILQGEIVGGKWGYIRETDFSEAIAFDFDRAFDFVGKLAIVQTGGNWGSWGVIDNTGKTIVPFTHPTYSFDMRPHPSIQFLKAGKQLQIDISGNGNQWIVADLTGKKISGPVEIMHGIYENPNEKEEMLMKNAEKLKEEKIAKDNFALKTNKGSFVCSGDLTCIAKGIYIADIKDENKKTFFGLIDENNNVLVPFIYDVVSFKIADGLIKVARNNKYGFCDLQGNEKIKCIYPYAEDFQNGIAVVFLSRDYSDDSKGYINTNGLEFFKSEPVYEVGWYNSHSQIADQYGNFLNLTDNAYNNALIIRNTYFITYHGTYAKLHNAEGKLLCSGTAMEYLGGNCVLVTENKMQKIVDLSAGAKTSIDSIDHLTTKVSFPASLNLFGYSYIHKNGNYGVFSITGREVIPPLYNFNQFTGIYFILHNAKGQTAICDTNYQFVKPFTASNVTFLGQYLFSVQNKNYCEIYDARTNTTTNYKIVVPKSGSVLPGVFVTAAKTCGYVNVNTEEILPPVYSKHETVKMFDENYTPVDFIKFKQANEKYSLYNTFLGKIVLADADETANAQGRFLPVKLNGRYWFVDANGKKVFDSSYEDVKSVREEGYSAAKNNGKWGIIDRENAVILPFKYDDITDMVDGYITCKEGNLFGLVNEQDSMLIKPQYTSLENVSIEQDTTGITYYYVAEKNKKLGIIDQKNNVISPFEYEGKPSFPFSTNAFLIEKNNEVVMFSGKGKCILSGGFTHMQLFDGTNSGEKEMVLASKGKKYGLYYMDGTQVLPAEYENIEKSEFLYDWNDRIYAEIKKDGKKGLFCSTGEITIPVRYELLQTSYGNDVAYTIVKAESKYGLYKNFRKKLVDCIYDEIQSDEEASYRNSFIVKYKGKYGLIDTSGKFLLPAEYDKMIISYMETDTPAIYLTKKGKVGLALTTGKILVPAIFDKIEPDYDLGETTWYTYRNKMVGLYRSNGTEVVPCEFKTKEYYGEEDGAYLVTFIAKNGEKWGLSSTFVFEKIQK